MKDLSMMELAVTYTALQERIQHLRALPDAESDVQLQGEIFLSESACAKVKALYVSKRGSDAALD